MAIMAIIITIGIVTPLVIFHLYFRRPVDTVYGGDYPELLSVAMNSVLGVGSDIGWHWPDITILEEDDYGRILFEYSEGSFFRSRLIMQKVEDGYAYFYPHYNFIMDARPRVILWDVCIPDFPDEETLNRWLELQRELQELFEEDAFESFEERSEIVNSMSLILREFPDFPDEAMEYLRQVNSWNQPLSDTSEFVRVKIVREKETGPIPLETLVEVYHEFLPDPISWMDIDSIPYSLIFLRTDNYGRSIYSMPEIQFVLLFQPNHSFDPEIGLLEPTDRKNYQTELRLFMEANGWDTPFTD